MEHKILVVIVTVLSLFHGAYALNCYKCHSAKPGNSDCYDPVDKSKVSVIACDKTNAKIDDDIMRSHIDRNLLDRAGNGNEYICIQYEQGPVGSTNTEMVRSCHPKIENLDVCHTKNITLQNESKNLYSCKVCEGDQCNGPDPDSATGLSVSLLVSIVSVTLGTLVR